MCKGGGKGEGWENKTFYKYWYTYKCFYKYWYTYKCSVLFYDKLTLKASTLSISHPKVFMHMYISPSHKKWERKLPKSEDTESIFYLTLVIYYKRVRFKRIHVANKQIKLLMNTLHVLQS